MIPAYSDQTVTLWHGDCLDVLRELPDCSVDSVVTDPPYGLEFMGKEWDKFGVRDQRRIGDNPGTVGAFHGTGVRYKVGASYGGDTGTAMRAFQQWCELWAAECLRVLKPGGHLLAFGGSRTYHRMTSGVEDAGFEIRDCITWHFGSGFPKSLDVSKAIDKAAGAEREVVGQQTWTSPKMDAGRGVSGLRQAGGFAGEYEGARVAADITAPATPAAEQWQGWGTALKPATEYIVVARKPLSGTVAANVTTWGTGALNIDGCRVGLGEGEDRAKLAARSGGAGEKFGRGIYQDGMENDGGGWKIAPSGRWPANVVLDEAMAEVLDQQSGTLTSGANPTRRGSDKFRDAYGDFKGQEECTPARGVDVGGASRFYYVAKADASERPRVNGVSHSTVKPLTLMRWLVRLVTPPGGTVLEPFAGSGTTVEACIVEGFRCIAIERETEYLPLIEARITRRRDPVRAIELAGEDLGLFGIEEVS